MITQSAKLTKEMILLAKESGCLEKIYGEEVNRLIREKYSASEEIAIHRHFLNGEKKDEFDEYNAFCEKCKEQANANITALIS